MLALAGYSVSSPREPLDAILLMQHDDYLAVLIGVAIVAPIAVLVEGDGREYRLRATDVVAKHLRESLLAIQERRAPDPFGWTQELTFN